MTKVLGDILLALNDGNISTLTLLALSAAFDTVDHDILLRHLEVSYGLGAGFGPTSTAELSQSTGAVRPRTQLQSCPARLGPRTDSTSAVHSGSAEADRDIIYIHMCMPMIHKSTSSVHHLMLYSFSRRCLLA